MQHWPRSEELTERLCHALSSFMNFAALRGLAFLASMSHTSVGGNGADLRPKLFLSLQEFGVKGLPISPETQ